MRTIPIKEYLKKNPGYRPAWVYRDYCLANPDFAFFEQVVVVDDRGSVLWDQVAIKERGGVIIVPYTLDPLRVGLIEVSRPVAGLDASIEFPRGFSRLGEPRDETAVRELEEETGLTPQALTWLGMVNANTAFCVHSVDVCAVLVSSWDGARPDKKETRRVIRPPREDLPPSGGGMKAAARFQW